MFEGPPGPLKRSRSPRLVSFCDEIAPAQVRGSRLAKVIQTVNPFCAIEFRQFRTSELTASVPLQIINARDPSAGPLSIAWPAPGDPNGKISFATFSDWRAFVLALSPLREIPAPVAEKFRRAQKLYILAWLDLDLIKAGELIALTALESALTDSYAAKETERRLKLVAEKAEKALRPISKKEKWWTEYTAFADLLKYMVERDGLTDDKIPMNARCGGALPLVDRLTGAIRPSLWDLRNDLAHGATTEGFPASGLLELVRDLIDYAYRDAPLERDLSRIA